MKKLIFVSSFLFSASAMAAGAQSYILNCQSRSAEIILTASVSEADGFSADDFRLKRAEKSDVIPVSVIRDVEQYGSNSASKFAFFAGGKLYSLLLSDGAFFAAEIGKSQAKIGIDGKVETANCVGTRQY